jgi:gliding motility-associated-like protein
MKRLITFLLGTFAIFNYSNAQNGYCSITISPLDTTVCMGDSVLVTTTSNLLNAGQAFNFNSASLPSNWSVAGGTSFSAPCGQNATGTAYYWAASAGSGTPQITTSSFDISCGGFISFDMVFATQGGAAPCEGPDLANEGVTLQYSTNGGATWTTIVYYSPGGYTLPSNPGTSGSVIGAGQNTPYTTWGTFTVPIPPGAATTGTMFQWIQTNSSGSCCDNWGLDNIVINATGAPCGSTTVVNWTNGLQDTDSFWVVPYADTTFQALVYDTAGNYQCQSPIININVYPDAMTYDLVDTVFTYCPDATPSVGVLNAGNSQTPFTYQWSTPSTTNPTILPTSGLEHDTLLYYVTITDGCGYTREDSVYMVINQLLQIDTIYMGPATCEPTGYVSVQISGQTVTPQTGVSYNWSGPGPNSPNFINASVWTDLPSGWYYVTVEDAVCDVNDSVFVDILNPPIASFSITPELGCTPLEVTITNNSQNASTFEWNFGNGQTTTVNNMDYITQTFTEDAQIQLTASEGNCDDVAFLPVLISVCGCTDPIAINYNPLAEVDDGSCIPPTPTVEVPNVFTPNEDGDNDFFFLNATNALNIDLTIINRWGNVVFEGSGINPAWNGKTDSGAEATDGVYFYKYVLKGYQDAVLEGHGYLHLQR